MHYLLLIGFGLFVVFLAPLKVTAAILLTLVVVAVTVKVVTRTVAQTDVSLGSSLGAVALALAFAAIMLFTLFSFSVGTGITQFFGLSAILVLAAFLASYVLGFKLALHLTWGSGSLVALIATVITAAFFFGLRRILQ
jgi:hypothetical protein